MLFTLIHFCYMLCFFWEHWIRALKMSFSDNILFNILLGFWEHTICSSIENVYMNCCSVIFAFEFSKEISPALLLFIHLWFIPHYLLFVFFLVPIITNYWTLLHSCCRLLFNFLLYLIFPNCKKRKSSYYSTFFTNSFSFLFLVSFIYFSYFSFIYFPVFSMFSWCFLIIFCPSPLLNFISLCLPPKKPV